MKVVCFDLDDTLVKEMDYVRSAYAELVRYAAARCSYAQAAVETIAGALRAMLAAREQGGDAFSALNTFLGTQESAATLLALYRNHHPTMRLSEEVAGVLQWYLEAGHTLGLITDGRSVQQRNKIKALGLADYIAEPDIVISEEFGSEKPDLRNYAYFMQRYPHAEEYIYVGDNPQKDFKGANELGWKTICLADNGENIHRQRFDLPADYLPDTIIEHPSELRSCVSAARQSRVELSCRFSP